MDGLWAALNILEEDFEIMKINIATEPLAVIAGADFILGWGGFNSPVDKKLTESIGDIKKGLCIGGNAFPYHEGYDVLFYETEWSKKHLGLPESSIHAFGINSDIYNEPNLPFPLIFDYIGVGSLSYWKRWEKMADKKGMRLVVGEYQKENEQESSRIATHLLRSGVMVSNMVSPYDLSNFYHWSRTAYIPATIDGGGERAVLEARACGLKVEVENDNDKLQELLTSPIWDEKYYASQLKKGILSCI
jgi:hypothetical protein